MLQSMGLKRAEQDLPTEQRQLPALTHRDVIGLELFPKQRKRMLSSKCCLQYAKACTGDSNALTLFFLSISCFSLFIYFIFGCIRSLLLCSGFL